MRVASDRIAELERQNAEMFETVVALRRNLADAWELIRRYRTTIGMVGLIALVACAGFVLSLVAWIN